MTDKKSTTVAEYSSAAPDQSHPHLQRLYDLLKEAAPDADETIKWNPPFFVEPRFLFAFSAHKFHLSFSPSAATLEVFREQLTAHQTTKEFLKLSYKESLPENQIRQIAEYRVKAVSEREDDAFW